MGLPRKVSSPASATSMPRARLDPAEVGVVHAAVDGIDHHPGAVGDLVDHADADDLADQRHLARAALEQGHGGGTAVDAELLEHLLHGPELVGAVAEPAQLALQLAVELPHALLALLGETEPLQRLEAADPQGLLHGVLLLGRW